MSKITKLTAGKSREKRVNVYLDGRYAFSLLAEVALKEGLKVGQELSDDQIEALTGVNRYQHCLNAAIRYLGYRPRSEAEIRQRLQKHGFDSASTDKALARLKEQGLVDDTAFAQFWKDNRESFSPRSRRLTKLELQRKGLGNDIIEQVVSDVDDSDSAYRAALNKARRLSPSDYQVFRRRLGEHLGRRGFGYDVINETVARVWKEYGGVTK
ncbi:MAG: RecX family transcriptional regulator [Dehalococcoidales bacterium]|nr:RecX family transcriptional regulator [Dehalococcoidales bacterium]